MSVKNPTIGMMSESSLHRALKLLYSGSQGETETPACGYICDGRTRGGELIEVQCGSFGPLKEKLETLTKKNKVRVIHPIIVQKHIELYDASGCLLHRRKSPRKGSAWDLFKVLLYAPELPLLKNLTIELAFVETIEKRTDDGKGSWWRRGIRVSDRALGGVSSSLVLSKLKDYYQFIPFKKNEVFTACNLAKKARIDARLARKTLYVLTRIGLAEHTGKVKQAFTYERR